MKPFVNIKPNHISYTKALITLLRELGVDTAAYSYLLKDYDIPILALVGGGELLMRWEHTSSNASKLGAFFGIDFQEFLEGRDVLPFMETGVHVDVNNIRLLLKYKGVRNFDEKTLEVFSKDSKTANGKDIGTEEKSKAVLEERICYIYK